MNNKIFTGVFLSLFVIVGIFTIESAFANNNTFKVMTWNFGGFDSTPRVEYESTLEGPSYSLEQFEMILNVEWNDATLRYTNYLGPRSAAQAAVIKQHSPDVILLQEDWLICNDTSISNYIYEKRGPPKNRALLVSDIDGAVVVDADCGQTDLDPNDPNFDLDSSKILLERLEGIGEHYEIALQTNMSKAEYKRRAMDGSEIIADYRVHNRLTTLIRSNSLKNNGGHIEIKTAESILFRDEYQPDEYWAFGDYLTIPVKSRELDRGYQVIDIRASETDVRLFNTHLLNNGPYNGFGGLQIRQILEPGGPFDTTMPIIAGGDYNSNYEEFIGPPFNLVCWYKYNDPDAFAAGYGYWANLSNGRCVDNILLTPLGEPVWSSYGRIVEGHSGQGFISAAPLTADLPTWDTTSHSWHNTETKTGGLHNPGDYTRNFSLNNPHARFWGTWDYLFVRGNVTVLSGNVIANTPFRNCPIPLTIDPNTGNKFCVDADGVPMQLFPADHAAVITTIKMPK